MNNLVNFLLGMAKSAQNSGTKNKINDLARVLNESGFKTQRGTPYSTKNNRGVGKLLSSTYKTVFKHDKKAAQEIADTFVGKNGKQPWL